MVILSVAKACKKNSPRSDRKRRNRKKMMEKGNGERKERTKRKNICSFMIHVFTHVFHTLDISFSKIYNPCTLIRITYKSKCNVLWISLPEVCHCKVFFLLTIKTLIKTRDLN